MTYQEIHSEMDVVCCYDEHRKCCKDTISEYIKDSMNIVFPTITDVVSTVSPIIQQLSKKTNMSNETPEHNICDIPLYGSNRVYVYTLNASHRDIKAGEVIIGPIKDNIILYENLIPIMQFKPTFMRMEII